METLVVGVVEDNTVFRRTVSERWLTFSTTAMEVRSNILKVERNGLYVCSRQNIFTNADKTKVLQEKQKQGDSESQQIHFALGGEAALETGKQKAQKCGKEPTVGQMGRNECWLLIIVKIIITCGIIKIYGNIKCITLITQKRGLNKY